MNHDRRDFLKWLSVAPLAAACSSQNATSQSDRLPVTGESTHNSAASRAAAAPSIKPSEYTSGDDQRRMRRTLSYGQGLPNDPECTLTGPDILGPFHRAGAPKRKQIAATSEPGKRLVIRGRVLHHDCKTPVGGALLDIWHADIQGRYDNTSASYRLRGQVTTDAQGHYSFETIQPGHYPLGDTMRPAHIHFLVSYPGCHPLTTQLYFKGDPYLKPNDPCGSCSSGDASLIVELKGIGGGTNRHLTGTFDIVLAKA